jgi:hypothetical protein
MGSGEVIKLLSSANEVRVRPLCGKIFYVSDVDHTFLMARIIHAIMPKNAALFYSRFLRLILQLPGNRKIHLNMFSLLLSALEINFLVGKKTKERSN